MLISYIQPLGLNDECVGCVCVGGGGRCWWFLRARRGQILSKILQNFANYLSMMKIYVMNCYIAGR